ncbi:Uracil-DNA glycosylase, family 4 [Candidatus Desulfarcum epimagneticum]|uniref:Uracil-DNA glycosylase, family 4 n=1 Tax=uncultured Desulfobacteraceae bacterium TaxID=218296 RepID=A0A484HPU1_9BACT|nr:Uracil-DNA glycosylase, family 4 [uncultured Desulfobacteraceae bacterium]
MDLNTILKCDRCCLRENQLPLLDNTKSADIFWVGLSAVKVENIKNDTPLCEKTNSGKLISAIEETMGNVSFYKTNLVKCLPLNESKIRYPNSKEMSACYDHLIYEINAFKPKVVFLLGKIVSDFIAKREKITIGPLHPNFEYIKLNIINTTIVPIHHPSYIQIYKRKKVNNYMSAVKNICEA